MDTVHNGILFRNGSSITVTYEPYMESRHIDANRLRQFGYSSGDILINVYNNVCKFDDRYELVIADGKIEIKEKEAPDFGEISPSQELNDFVATLAQGK